MNEEMRNMFNAILEEIGRVEEKMDRRLGRLESEIEALHHEVNACKLESDAVGLLIRRMDRVEQHVAQHEKRMTWLEQKQNKNLSMV